MENRVYKIAFVEDMIFDLCVNKSLLVSPSLPMTDEDREWFNVRLGEALCIVREKIVFLLAEDDKPYCEPLCFSLIHKYRLHQTSLPMKIENALVEVICGRWVEENLGESNEAAAAALAALKSMALRQDSKYNRNSNII